MCMYPDHASFRKHVQAVTEGLEKGIYEGVYNHQDSSCCVVGLALAHFTEQPVDAGQTGELLSRINNPHLSTLFNTFDMSNVRDQKQGAAKGRTYLAATADLETV